MLKRQMKKEKRREQGTVKNQPGQGASERGDMRPFGLYTEEGATYKKFNKDVNRL